VLPPGELEYFYSGEDSSEVAKDQEKKFNYEGNSIPVRRIVFMVI